MGEARGVVAQGPKDRVARAIGRHEKLSPRLASHANVRELHPRYLGIFVVDDMTQITRYFLAVLMAVTIVMAVAAACSTMDTDAVHPSTRPNLHNLRRRSASNKDVATAVLCAAMCGREVLYASLARPDVDVSAATLNGQMALTLAARSGQAAAVQVLLADADVEPGSTTAGGWTALMVAAAVNDLIAVEALLAHPGVDVNAGVRDGRTALMAAGFNGHTAIVRALLAHADIDQNAAKTSRATRG
jgi:hypothetical protein